MFYVLGVFVFSVVFCFLFFLFFSRFASGFLFFENVEKFAIFGFLIFLMFNIFLSSGFVVFGFRFCAFCFVLSASCFGVSVFRFCCLCVLYFWFVSWWFFFLHFLVSVFVVLLSWFCGRRGFGVEERK